MCVIVVKPAGIKLKRIYWAECFRMNGHGAGLSYVENNELIVDKGYFDFEELYKEIEKHEEKELLVHFRISSAGAINIANCHPFFFDSQLHPKYAWAIAHNGTLDYESNKDESDTNLFVNKVLGPQLARDPWFLDDHPGQHFLKTACRSKWAAGNDSKIVVFRYDNEAKESKIYIANKQLGVEDHGCWFSNGSFRLPMVYQGYQRGGGMHHMGVDWEAEDGRFFVERSGFMSEKDWSKHGYYQNAEGMWIPNRHRVIPRQTKLLAPASPQSQQQEQQKTNAELAKSDTSASRPIVVPRDDEVRAQRNKEVRFNSRLDHLSKKGKRNLKRLASDYAKSELDEDEFARLGAVDMIMCFRDSVRYHQTDIEVCMKEDKDMDQWIVDQYFKCIEQPNMNIWDQLGLGVEDATPSAPEDITSQEDGPDDIDEAVGADARLGHIEQFPLDAAHAHSEQDGI